MHDGVEDNEQLAHGGHEGHLPRFAYVAQSRIESTDGCHSRHVKDLARAGMFFPNTALALLLATVLVQGCDTEQ